ncbi:MAG: hypothetical protein ABI972_22815, partial [Acidobacteriota bacterium]
ETRHLSRRAKDSQGGGEPGRRMGMENVTPRRHATEEELIAHYYGCEEQFGAAEADATEVDAAEADAAEVGAAEGGPAVGGADNGGADNGGAETSAGVSIHLAGCAECRAAFEALKRDLQVASELVVPDREAAYEANVWARLAAAEPKLLGRRTAGLAGWRNWFAPRHLVLAGSLAALVAVAFLAGRYSNGVTTPAVVAERGAAKTERTPGKAGRERILAAALDTHLADSERILLDVVNSEESASDWDSQRDKAESLIDANRLYRLTAARQGQVALAAVLEDLERVLLELAHEPDKNTSAQMTPLRERITDQELVFKLRILQLRLRDQPRRTQVDRKG